MLSRITTLPPGVGPTGPTRLRPLLDGDLLSVPELLRAAVEPVLAIGHRLGDDEDVAVGPFLRRRFGAAVTERVVDPLLGNLHAADVQQLSLRACAPALVTAAQEGAPLSPSVWRQRSEALPATWRRLRGRCRPPAPSAMPLLNWPGGISTLVHALAGRARRHGASIQACTPVRAVSRDQDLLIVHAEEASIPADAVVLAVPAAVASALLTATSTRAATVLAGQSSTSVVTALARFPRSAVPAELAGVNGMLVASRSQRALKAATLLSNKWPHINKADDFLIRLSAGRHGGLDVTGVPDDRLVRDMLADLTALTGLGGATDVLVHRWPDTVPLQLVGHLDRVARARRVLAEDAPGVYLAGCAVDGVGMSSCVSSGDRAAEDVMAFLPAITTAGAAQGGRIGT
ncbi:MAG: protoporphyrinogen oxidase [Micrococcales bacterium]|nr:MAG: protoporphyrinogen oxidase [Micrococcales bacterium]